MKSQQTIQDYVAMRRVEDDKWINIDLNRNYKFFCICIYKPWIKGDFHEFMIPES